MMGQYPYRLAIILLSAFTCTQVAESSAQALINDTNLYIPEALEVHVDGGFRNSGFIQNQGSMLITGDWLNTNVYQGLGTITLEGTTAQQFNNNSNGVYHLEITNGGTKKLIGNNTVLKSLLLKEGIVTVTASDNLTIEDGASITGGSTDSYIDGALDHNGSGYKFFPIGKNGGYYPVELLDITGAKVTTAMEVFTNTSTLTLPSTYKLFSNVYWQKTIRTGTFVSSPLSLGYTVADGYTDDHSLEILQAENNASAFLPLGQTTVDFQNGIDRVSSSNGARASVFVIGESTTFNPSEGVFYFSTSLSPSAADPQNRTIRVFGNELTDDNFLFVVYNRWGLKVFETRSLQEMSDKGWDGAQDKGRDYLPSGAYPFIMKGTKLTGEAFEKKGAITIIR